jgi:hypothetical protein
MSSPLYECFLKLPLVFSPIIEKSFRSSDLTGQYLTKALLLSKSWHLILSFQFQNEGLRSMLQKGFDTLNRRVLPVSLLLEY